MRTDGSGLAAEETVETAAETGEVAAEGASIWPGLGSPDIGDDPILLFLGLIGRHLFRFMPKKASRYGEGQAFS